MATHPQHDTDIPQHLVVLTFSHHIWYHLPMSDWWSEEDDLKRSEAPYTIETSHEGQRGKWRLDVMSERTQKGNRMVMAELVFSGTIEGNLSLSIYGLDE
jgi:hypothetical protein